jgi:hypothetical protein
VIVEAPPSIGLEGSIMTQVPVTYSYVYFGSSGRHERRPVRTAGGPGGFNLIEQRPGGTVQTGDQFLIGIPLPATLSAHGVTFEFAFVNVSGGSPSGSQVSFNNAEPPAFVTVESAPINVLSVYLPTGGGGSSGGGEPGATIDSFDETTGSLFNDVFVSVAPDPGGALTASGNDFGFVDTARSEEAITALSPTSSEVLFDQWHILSPPPAPIFPPPLRPVDKNLLAVGKGLSVTALAFYKAPVPPSQAQTICSQAVQFLEQIIRDRGPLLLASQMNELKATLEHCVAEGFLTQAAVDNLLHQYATIRETPPTPPARPGGL